MGMPEVSPPTPESLMSDTPAEQTPSTNSQGAVSTPRSEASTAHARVRSGEFWRALDRLVALPAPLEIRVGIEPDHVVLTEYDEDHEWWSTVAVPRTDARDAAAPTAGVTVPRMETREIVGLETLDADENPMSHIEVTDGVGLRLDSNTVAASRSTAPIPTPPVLDHDAAVDRVAVVPDKAGRPDTCVLAVGETGGHGTVELSGRAVERFEARRIRHAVLVRTEDEFFLAGATDDPPPEQIFLVARVHRVDLRGADA